jgi:ParB-like chromosome segregation protein Spo0J
LNITENLQRNTYISPLAEAKGHRSLILKGWSIHDIALKIGKSDSYVCDRLRIMNRLHPEIQRMLECPTKNCNLTISHAEHLSLLNDYESQLELARLVREKKLTVRQLERIVRKSLRTAADGCLCPKCVNYPCALHSPTKGARPRMSANTVRDIDKNTTLTPQNSN